MGERLPCRHGRPKPLTTGDDINFRDVSLLALGFLVATNRSIMEAASDNSGVVFDEPRCTPVLVLSLEDITVQRLTDEGV